MNEPDTIKINEVEYVPIDSIKTERPAGNRHVVIVDRGWIFAGDIVEDGDRIVLERVVNIRRWESMGLEGVIDNPKSSKVTIRKMPHAVSLPAGAEIFRIPVSDSWGL